MSKFVKRINKCYKENTVKQFLVKYNLPLTGEISVADIIKLIPDTKSVIDNEGRKRVNLPGGFLSLEGLDKLLSE